ncbi:hypothetical protein C1645_781103 [Glomus cerebriforme]|uniref:Uncharacterized protein n=1 Tax=Glomus cerebriforme TaxID=658196 RepID=A0A397SP47_9GLOM|nr:hypothetical protein C1645_781103 [Glomus cerebriforme]
MRSKTCFFSINGEKYPVAFHNLPDVIYPTVSLNSPEGQESNFSKKVKDKIISVYFYSIFTVNVCHNANDFQLLYL